MKPLIPRPASLDVLTFFLGVLNLLGVLIAAPKVLSRAKIAVVRPLVAWCIVALVASVVSVAPVANGDDSWPQLPVRNGAVEIPGQEWPRQAGPRRVRMQVHFPQGSVEHVKEKTGVMLTLHNWGGEDCAGTANPDALANRLNVVAVCVNYLQSGRQASIEDPRPYDFGYLQALDALRCLWFVCNGLKQAERPFAQDRLFCTGGSGGGNVTLMANKLAPRSFACIIDMCGMKKLSHDIAFNLPGGSGLNARWSRDPDSPSFLSVDEQELRFVGMPSHLATMKQLGNRTKIVVVHGVDDATCPFADAQEMVGHLQAAGLDVEPHFIDKADLDGRVLTSTGHSLGNRTEIVFRVAERYLTADGPEARRLSAPSDFEQRGEVRYRTSHGEFVISYEQGYPTGRFVPAEPPVVYDEHQSLLYYLDRDRSRHEITSADQWSVRSAHILANLQQVMGTLPGETMRAPLAIRVLEESRQGKITRRKIEYSSDPLDRVPAWLLIPDAPANSANAVAARRPAVLCLHQTVAQGKDEVAGLSGSANMHYARELAERGFVTLAPDYPSMGQHAYDFAEHPEYASGTMKAIWDNIRAVDLLQSLPEVDGQRIGVIGHSLGGHGALFTAAFEPRLKAIVSSCGFTRLPRDDVPSWTGPRYMPRIASVYSSDAKRLPFDFPEIVAGLAPRPFLACAATRDSDFDVQGVRETMEAALPVYRLLGQPEHLQAFYPDGPHDFPREARQRAYAFLDEHLGGRVAGKPQGN